MSTRVIVDAGLVTEHGFEVTGFIKDPNNFPGYIQLLTSHPQEEVNGVPSYPLTLAENSAGLNDIIEAWKAGDSLVNVEQAALYA